MTGVQTCALPISIFIVTFIGYFDTKIRTRDDVEKYLDLPVIGERRSIR